MRGSPIILVVVGLVSAGAYGYNRGLGLLPALAIFAVVLAAMAVWHWDKSRLAGDPDAWDRRFDLELAFPLPVEEARWAVERGLSAHAKFVAVGKDGEFSALAAQKRWHKPVWPVNVQVTPRDPGSHVKLTIRYEDGLFDFGACARKLTEIRDAIASEADNHLVAPKG